MKNKILGVVLFLIGLIALSGIVNAQPIYEDSVSLYIDNIEIQEGTSTGAVEDLEFERIDKGEILPIKVRFRANETTGDNNDVEIEVEIKGDSHGDTIAAETDVFDLDEGGWYTKKLNLELTKRMDTDIYDVYLTIRGRRSNINVQREYAVKVVAPEHLVDIDDVIFSPNGVVRAGRTLVTKARVKNNGARKEEGVKVEVSIPELGIAHSDYIDNLEPEGDDNGDDETTSEPLYMKIPDCAEQGEYTVNVDVTYDDGDEKVSTTRTIEVIPGDMCELDFGPGDDDDEEEEGPQTIIKVQDVSTDGTGTYQMTLTNTGRSPDVYTISVDGGDLLDAVIQPSNTVVVDAQDSQTLIIFVDAKPGVSAGTYGFSITVSSGDEVLEQIPLTATVDGSNAGSGISLKRGLEIGLVVLVVLLVILGLIIGFNKLKGEEDEDGEGTKTYY